MKTRKNRQEIANSFYVRQGEIERLFGIGKVATKKCFQAAQKIDQKELKDCYFDSSQVRLSSVLQVLGISNAELKAKV